jgi:asparagine synthase (glutamine-hydrolysing)
MCGICGIYRGSPTDRRILGTAVTRMSAILRHRGPDDEGVWTDASGRVSLGNRRLAIIDCSAGGHQPMVAAAGTVALTFNGCIYNYPDLRREFAASGYPFRGHSDTEVILALYMRDGVEMCRHLRGMFALALWDGRTQRLLLARDRFGIKPLYYAVQDEQWVFASEIKALLASGLMRPRVNPSALAAFLRLGSVPGPMTAVDGIYELPPATVAVVDASGASLRRYWELPAPSPDGRNEDAVVVELRDRFDEAVRRHLVSDVPLGVFLSGGLDSGAIVATMRASRHERIRTFSISFPDSALDEGPDAARLAAQYGTEHTASEVRGDDVAAELDRVIAAMDQPTIDGLNTYYVSRLAREYGTIVALSGLGGDELFCGYRSFHQVPRLLAWQHAAARLGPVRPMLTAALGAVPGPRSAKLREGLEANATIQAAYLAVRGLFSANEISTLLVPGPLRDAARRLDAADVVGALAPVVPDDPVAATGILELRVYLHNQLLRDTDVMSMAHSLEVRVPFLDHPLVEFAAALPSPLRRNGHPPKSLLRRAIGARWPLSGAAKRGFAFPMDAWLHGPLRPRVEDALRDGAKLFRPNAVAALQGRVDRGHAHWSRLWALVVLALWLRAGGYDAALAA